MLKILVFTTLFPNPSQPRHGIFVLQRLRQLLASGQVNCVVVAPVPYYPAWLPAPAAQAALRSVPPRSTIDGIDVLHPRYPVIPKVGMTLAPRLLERWTRGVVESVLHNGFDADLIDAHYFYPDGIAAAALAKRLGLPFVVTARGTDINLIPRYRLPRRMILSAAGQAGAIITVCDALRDRLIELGADAGKVRTLRNGVDPQIFFPVDRAAARSELGIDGRTLVSVGHLIERKGHHLTIQALQLLEDCNLVLVGTGPEDEALRRLAATLGVADRVRFAGEVSQLELHKYYSACDASVLASSREGMANVLLESIACGCPVIATRIWGTPEVIASPAAGLLVEERGATAIAAAVRQFLADPPDRAATVRYSANFHWDATTAGQLEIFESLVRQGHWSAAG